VRLLSKSILLTLSALVSCIGSGRAQSPAVSKGMYEIAGVVLNTRTGLPVRDAEVTLRRTKDNERLAETATNAEGHFSFPQLSSDKYSLLASHRGYIPAAYDEHENGSTAIVTGAGLTSTGLRFMLAPQAVLFGAITDDSYWTWPILRPTTPTSPIPPLPLPLPSERGNASRSTSRSIRCPRFTSSCNSHPPVPTASSARPS
jgi:hypothetical protein